MSRDGKHHTKEEELFIRDNYGKISVEEIAIKLDRNPTRVRGKIERLRLRLISTENKVGDRFGKLVLIKRAPPRGNKNRRAWYCKCDCGTVMGISILENSLKTGTTKSCGCKKAEAVIKRNIGSSGEPGLASKTKLFGDYVHKSRKNKQLFELTYDQFFDIVSQNCTYCGAEPRSFSAYLKANGELQDKFQVRKETADRSIIFANGVDRIDSDIGYILENCVPCCKMCNYAKRDFSIDEFLDRIVRTYNNISEIRKRIEKNNVKPKV